MSQLVYNGIQLDAIKSTNVSQEAVYDDSRTDYLYTKLTIAVRAIFNPGLTPTSGGETNPTQTIARVRSYLMTPRCNLTFSVNGQTLVQSPEVGKLVDYKNGPFPLHCNIVAISGSQTMIVDYGIETYIRECPNGNTLPVYLSNRWSESVTIDELWLSKRTRRGKIVFRANFLNNALVNADDYRALVVPPLVQGFVRTSSEYAVQEDGLAMMYTFTDEERLHTPPFPTVKFEGQNTIATTNGAVFNQDVNCRVWGNRETSKALLIQAAVLVCLSRISNDLTNPTRTGSILSGSVTDSLHENMVEVKIHVLNSANPNTYYDLNTPGGNTWLDKVYGENINRNPPDPSTRGTAEILKLVAPVLNDPCLNTYLTSLSTLPTNPPTTLQASSPAVVTLVPLIPNQSSLYNAAQLQNSIYTDYKIDVRYFQDMHTAQLPVQNTGGSTCSFVTLAQPTMKKVVEWTAERIGDKPIIPSPNDLCMNEVYLNGEFQPAAPVTMPSGQNLIWRCSGRYVYGIKDSSQVVLSSPVLPWLTVPLSATGYDNTQFGTGLITGQCASNCPTAAPAVAINPGGQAPQPPVLVPVP